MMTLTIFEETEKDIENAYKSQNKPKIEKETSYVLSQIIVIMLGTFKERLKEIAFDTTYLHFNEQYILSDKNRLALLEWLKRLMLLSTPTSDLEFGKLKLDLENWYYQISGQDIDFEYRENYLIKPKQAAVLLGVSNVTLNKYMKQGFEHIDTSSHNKIPKHAVDLWKDPVYCVKMQYLYQEKKRLRQTPEERLSETYKELMQYKKKYKTPNIEEAFEGVDIDAIDDPSDYYEWRDLLEEEEELTNQLIGEKDIE
ncbi:DNA-binding protein [Virgibacillus kekensis]|uniref:DNA-binding protein n=1 Tax=Virgibacillus kekensis TaxID=202261 RepID=A0ABV9DJ06_9BACI